MSAAAFRMTNAAITECLTVAVRHPVVSGRIKMIRVRITDPTQSNILCNDKETQDR